MKRTFILSAAVLATAALVLTSCQPSRVWATKKKDRRDYRENDRRDYREDDSYRYRETLPPPPPPRYHSVSLIISPTPGFVMRQSPNGSYYHRSPQGLLYWKGYDNRFYLDRAELRNVSYSRWEYEEWRKYNRQSR